MNFLQKEVTYEPAEALFGGLDGLDFYRKITELWRNFLNDGGILAYEIGMGQENDVSDIMKKMDLQIYYLSKTSPALSGW